MGRLTVTLGPRLRELGECTAVAAGVGLLAGGASALFLTLLERATTVREAHSPLVYLLPAVGLAVGWFYDRYGRSVAGGTGHVLAALHATGSTEEASTETSPRLPRRLAPMVMLGTVVTHLFGGSAGREGTAVQMGASLADGVGRLMGRWGRAADSVEQRRWRRHYTLVAGVAGGFGSVFGTPLAGTLFALELAASGRIEPRPLVPGLIAALVGDWVVRGLGVTHAPYPVVAALPLTPLLLGKWLLFAGGVAAVAVSFVALTHGVARVGQRLLPSRPLRMAVGGALVVLLWRASATTAYLGLGVDGISRALTEPTWPAASFAWKLVFTAVTVGSGFLGGEVTPLFFMGASLGNLLAGVLQLPLGLAAAVGLASMFAAASKAPLALSMMAVELMGPGLLPHVFIVCAVACVLTGRRGIYRMPEVRAAGGGPGSDEPSSRAVP